jgi:hypothetical protein
MKAITFFLNRVLTTGILGIRVSLVDTCHFVGAVHLNKYRAPLRSHLPSVDVTQVEGIFILVYKVEMCFVDTIRLYSKNTDVRYVCG